MKTIRMHAFAVLLAVVGFVVPASAQTYTLNSTTTAAAIATGDSTVSLTSVSAATGSSFGAVSVGQGLFVDQEFMLVTAVNSTTATVQRRNRRTTPLTNHASGQTVYIGAAGAFQRADPAIGTCAVAAQGDPWINVDNGKIWRCIGSVWLNVIDAYEFIQASNCWYSTSGGTFTTPAAVGNVGLYAAAYTGLTSAGTTPPGTPILQVATTSSGTATNTFSCLVTVPTRANTSRGIYLSDATWLYGVQQAVVNSTQVAVEASGTMNGVVAFGKIALPVAGASETASTVAQARWDTGTMVLTPAKASFNASTNTVGQFYTQKIAPAAPIGMTADLTAYYVNLTVLCAATTATTLNIAGVLIHYQAIIGL